MKHDRFHCLASKLSGLVRMCSRRGRSLNLPFPELVDELRALSDETVIDGGLVVVDERGHPQFEQLCARAFMMRRRVIRQAIAERPAASNCERPNASRTTSSPPRTMPSGSSCSSSTSSGNGRFRLRPWRDTMRTTPSSLMARQRKPSCFSSKNPAGPAERPLCGREKR